MQSPVPDPGGPRVEARQAEAPWYRRTPFREPGVRVAVFFVTSLLFFALLGASLIYRLGHERKAPGLALNYLEHADRLLASDYQGALEQYRIVSRIAPDDDRTWLRLGVAAKSAGRVDEALAAFSTLLRLGSRPAIAHQMLGAIYLDQQRIEDSIRHSRAAIALQPRFAEAYSNLATALLRKGDISAAIANYREALRIDRNLSAARMSLQALGLSPDNP
jgi:tetratricopeptide (TPR) repeat protein